MRFKESKDNDIIDAKYGFNRSEQGSKYDLQTVSQFGTEMYTTYVFWYRIETLL